nr:hypothetical protein [uncultured Halomonas sp.]
MAHILHFPVHEISDVGMERYLTSKECRALSLTDPFADWIESLDHWFDAHPQSRTTRNDVLRTLLADTWLVFHMACDKGTRLVMLPHHRRRWAQLEYHDLSDFELLVIVSDNLTDLRQGLRALSHQSPPQGRSDPSLAALIHGIDQFNRRLERLFDPESSAARQPEGTS